MTTESPHVLPPLQEHIGSKRAHSRLRYATLLLQVLWVVLVTMMVSLAIAAIFAAAAGAIWRYGTIGVETTWNDRKEYLLHPVPGGAAAMAGIPDGAILLAIDDFPVSPGMSVYWVEYRLRGALNTPVTLSVRESSGQVRQYTLLRHEEAVRKAWRDLGLQAEFLAVYFIVPEVILTFTWLLLAVLIYWYRASERFPLFLSFTMVLLVPQLSYIWTTLLFIYPGLEPLFIFLHTLSLICLLLSLYLLPAGRFVPRWTIILALVWSGWCIIDYVNPDSLFTFFRLPNWVAPLFYLSWFSTGILAQVYRYHVNSTLTQRQQMKWVIFGISIALLGAYGWQLAFAFFPVLNQPGLPNLMFWLVVRPLYVVSLLLVPITMLIAIRRYRLWDIDLILNRTLIYIPLTVLLAGLVSAMITVLQSLFKTLTGATSDIAIVISTLVLTLTFTPLKTGLQKLVDTYFKEAPDPARNLKTLSAKTRDLLPIVDRRELTQQLLREGAAAFQAETGAIYLEQGGRLHCIHQLGNWHDEPAQLRVVLESDGQRVGLLCLGAHSDGTAYTTHDSLILEQLVAPIARALQLMQPLYSQEPHLDEGDRESGHNLTA